MVMRSHWPPHRAGLAAVVALLVLVGAQTDCFSEWAEGASVARSTTAPAVARSAGCGERPAVPGLTRPGPGDVPLTFMSDGVDRSYRLGVPKLYDKNRSVPLVLDLHGANSNALQQSVYTDMPRLATARGMITVTPTALGGNWQLSPKGADDDFLVALVHDVESKYCINLNQVHVAGFSLGAWKATTTACGHPDIFASLGLGSEELHPTTCAPMPVIAFHGTADHTVPYGPGGDPGVTVTGPNAGLTGAQYNIASWAKGGRCSADKKVRDIGDDVVLWAYAGCAPGVEVELYSILHADHRWPGSPIVIAPTTNTVSATKLMLDFFESHPMRRHHS
jgi:polyhydroxybutyrate depolymerase